MDNKGNEVYCADPVQDIHVTTADFIAHKDYNAGTFKNDIALIKLPIFANTHQNNINTICLPFNPKRNIEKMTVMGFGRTEFSNLANSPVLRKVHVDEKDNDECSNILKLHPSTRLDNTQICARGIFK